jgi:hypothetical protein
MLQQLDGIVVVGFIIGIPVGGDIRGTRCGNTWGK